MDIISALESDHEEIRGLFKALLKDEQLEMADRKTLFPSLRTKILAHAEAEEKSLYEPLEQRGLLHDEVMEGREEHRLTAQMIDDIETAKLEDDEWMAKVKVLKDVLVHHLEEEEKSMFPEARKAFSSKDAKRMGETYETARDDVEGDQPRG